MPKKTNENKELNEEKELVVKKAEKKATKKPVKKSTSSTKSTTSLAKKTGKKVASSTKKTSEKTTTTASSKKGTTSKKATVEKKTTAKKTVKKEDKENIDQAKKTVKKAGAKTKKAETSAKPKAKKDTNKKVENKKKTTTKKAEAKPKAVKKDDKVVSEGKVKTEAKSIAKKKKEEVIKEETIIEKIKSFLAKIIAMQEEAREEVKVKNGEIKESKLKKNKEIIKVEKTEPTPYMLEYYDLPYRYNETVVKILAQTPKKLFVYWDISDYDREKYLKAFGERFFEETYPVLLVHNEDKNYTYEVAINDFANSWYLDIKDPKSKYVIELGRKFKTKNEMINIVRTEETKNIILRNDYVPIVSSNVLEVPNDHILFENVQTKLLYRNVKDNTETFVDIENNEYKRDMGHIYNIYDLYKEIYKNEIDDESLFDLLNPSSMSSSAFR